MNNQAEKISFLTNAISETQELIRFTETKTALAITLLSAYTIGVFTMSEKIIRYHYKFDLLFWSCLFGFTLGLLLCVIIITRIILHTTSPVKNIKGVSEDPPNLKYFLTPNENKDIFYPIKNRSRYKLKTSYSQYLKSISDSKIDDIVATLTLELMKVSYIRNLKSDRFRWLLGVLLFTTVLFALLYFVYTWEVQRYLPEESSCCKLN